MCARRSASPVVIPGYADLRSFSRDWEPLLKQECGGEWRSYFQRGNWRMLFPFSRGHQRRTARALRAAVEEEGRPEVVHLVRFPQLTINHALLVYDAYDSGERLVFRAYDPNNTRRPVELTYDKDERTFEFSRNTYFVGGRVDVYLIYSGWCY